MSIFDAKIKNVLECAQKLRLAGENELCSSLCTSCVKANAYAFNIDLLEFFYGKTVYDNILDETDAANAIFIAKCAYELFSLASKKSCLSNTNAWASVKGSACNTAMKEFFTWLQKKNRAIGQNDVVYFRSACKALNSGQIIYNVSYKYYQDLLTEIMSKIVDGRAQVGYSGELI